MTIAEKLEKFCERYNISFKYLDVILDDPKVIPMIRGKSFEFYAAEVIEKLLNGYKVENPRGNSSVGQHDVDILVTEPNGKKHSIECKLSGKGLCKTTKDQTEIKIKCMRSRTLGEKAIDFYSKHWNVSKAFIEKHRDQYRPSDFEYVVTTIGNAFYTTTEGQYGWNPTEQQKEFLNSLGIKTQKQAYERLYFARSAELTSTNTVRTCVKKTCKDAECAFIPNYPIMIFKRGKTEPEPPWYSIGNLEADFKKNSKEITD
jgi:hypothetical protein